MDLVDVDADVNVGVITSSMLSSSSPSSSSPLQEQKQSVVKRIANVKCIVSFKAIKDQSRKIRFKCIQAFFVCRPPIAKVRVKLKKSDGFNPVSVCLSHFFFTFRSLSCSLAFEH